MSCRKLWDSPAAVETPTRDKSELVTQWTAASGAAELGREACRSTSAHSTSRWPRATTSSAIDTQLEKVQHAGGREQLRARSSSWSSGNVHARSKAADEHPVAATGREGALTAVEALFRGGLPLRPRRQDRVLDPAAPSANDPARLAAQVKARTRTSVASRAVAQGATLRGRRHEEAGVNGLAQGDARRFEARMLGLRLGRAAGSGSTGDVLVQLERKTPHRGRPWTVDDFVRLALSLASARPRRRRAAAADPSNDGRRAHR